MFWSGNGVTIYCLPGPSSRTEEIVFMVSSSPKDPGNHAAPSAWTHGRATHPQRFPIPMPGGQPPLTLEGNFPLTPDALTHALGVIDAMGPGITVPPENIDAEAESFRNEVAQALGMSPDESDAELLRSIHQAID